MILDIPCRHFWYCHCTVYWLGNGIGNCHKSSNIDVWYVVNMIYFERKYMYTRLLVTTDTCNNVSVSQYQSNILKILICLGS